ncbi:unnamed protein product, partial [Hapterophycus canaliculatus]
RWIIRPAVAGKGNDGGQRCTATVTWRCVWHKFTVIKGLIEGKCRADVKSFNIAFLEGMRLHLLEAQESSRGLRRRHSLRESLALTASGGVSGSRRTSRDGSFSGRSLLSSFAGSEDGGSSRVFGRPEMGSLSDRGVEEWGRSSLALLDVREEARRLSDNLLQLDLAGGGNDDDGGANAQGWRSRKDKGMGSRQAEHQLTAVTGISRRVDGALTSLDATASQIRDATACLPSAQALAAVAEEDHETALAATCEDVCASGVAASAAAARHE